MLHVHPAHAVRDVRHLLRKVEALPRRALLPLLGRSTRRRTVHSGALLGRRLAVLRLLLLLVLVVSSGSLRRKGVGIAGADTRVARIRVLPLRRVGRRV